MSENKAPAVPEVTVHVIRNEGAAAPSLLVKADTSTQITDAERQKWGPEWIDPPYSLNGLETLVKESSILPQCIEAYRNNIAGFGIGIRYREDYDDETPEMMEEYAKAEEVIELLNMDEDTKEVFEKLLVARETFGIAYAEVIRNEEGQVEQLYFITDTPSIRKTKRMPTPVYVDYYYKDREVKRQRKFCKYRQKVGNQTVFFKEFGDPRVMDIHTGEYVNADIPLEDQANELLEFPIGAGPYGEVRWIGQVLGVDGSRKAESLNNRYFEDGRHTPLLIMIRGGKLTGDSFGKLQGYMEDIKGEKGQHAFLLMEVESDETHAGFDMSKQPEIQVIPLAGVLQKDELFQGYLDNNRRKVQSAFRLPDLYVGYTTDFNRATAETAVDITEQQVFQPERTSLAWRINNKLLADYRFRYVEAYLKAPEISNWEDIARILNITERAGGLPPNKAKEITFSVLGEVSEDYEGEWGNVPLAYTKSVATPSQFSLDQIGVQLSKQIAKAQAGADDAVVAVMKEVRALLVEMQKGDG